MTICHKFSWMSCMLLGSIMAITCFATIILISWLMFSDINKPLPLYVTILISSSCFIVSTLRERYLDRYYIKTYSSKDW